jgi:hypothetical protein
MKHLIPVLQSMWRSRKADDYPTMWTSPLNQHELRAMSHCRPCAWCWPPWTLLSQDLPATASGRDAKASPLLPFPRTFPDRSERLVCLGEQWVHRVLHSAGCPDCIATVDWEYTIGSGYVQAISRRPLTDERIEELLWRMIT